MNIKIKASSHDIAIHNDELWIKYEPSTSDLIAELERRRPCRKCKGFQTLQCVGCIWASVYKMKIDSDNFKEAI